MSLTKRYQDLLSDIVQIASGCGRSVDEIALIAVSKKCSFQKISKVCGAGCRDFGESRVLEALEKREKCLSDIRWHLIGSLQKNKVGKAVGNFHLIHSVDSFELALKISLKSKEASVKTKVLLQVNTSGEVSKRGFSEEELLSCFSELLLLEGISICGLMTIAPFVEDKEEIRGCFRKLRMLRDRLQKEAGKIVSLKELSMGMSRDYPIAIEEGATLLRVGAAIFDEGL